MSRFTDEPVVVGNDVDFTLNAKKDGVVWDITGASVKLYLRDPDGNWSSAYTATITNGTGGIATYSANELILDEYGDWARQWEVTKGGVTLRTKIKTFTVEPWQP